MTTDGGLDRWHVDGPVIWHSETSGLGYWYAGGIYSDYKAADSPPPTGYGAAIVGSAIVRGMQATGNSIVRLA